MSDPKDIVCTLPEGGRQAVKRGKQSNFLLSCKASELQHDKFSPKV